VNKGPTPIPLRCDTVQGSILELELLLHLADDAFTCSIEAEAADMLLGLEFSPGKCFELLHDFGSLPGVVDEGFS